MNTYLHVKCGKRVPNSAYHCNGCHHTFIGITAFDRHRKGGECSITPLSFDPYTESGFWADDRGYWHSGKRLTDSEKRDLFGGAA